MPLRKYIGVADQAGVMRSIALGIVTQEQAQDFCDHLRAVIAAQRIGAALGDDLERWLASLAQPILNRLAELGLHKKREAATLGDFIERYIESRRDELAETTLADMHQAANFLYDYFGATRPLRMIAPAECDGWRSWLKAQRHDGIAAEYSEAYLAKITSHTKRFLRAAVRDGFLAENPLERLKVGSFCNPARQRFVTRETAAAVLAACKTAEQRLIFSLGRFGGLRIPSEAKQLKWADVDWERGRITIARKKTEERVIPLFPELVEPLQDHREERWDRLPYVFCRLYGKTHYADRIAKAVKKSGVTPWPRLLHNLRASRATELMQDYPIHVVAAWIGHSPGVALEHYAMVRDSDFERATGRNLAAETETESERIAAMLNLNGTNGHEPH